MSNDDVNLAADLEILQRESFDYFLHETNPANTTRWALTVLSPEGSLSG